MADTDTAVATPEHTFSVPPLADKAAVGCVIVWFTVPVQPFASLAVKV